MSNEQIDTDLIKKGQKITKYGNLLMGAVVVVYVLWFFSVGSSSSREGQDLAFNLFFGGLAYGIPLLFLIRAVITLASDWMILKGTHSTKLILLLPILSIFCLFLGVWFALSDDFKFSSFSSYFLWGGIISFAIINWIHKMIISKEIRGATSGLIK